MEISRLKISLFFGKTRVHCADATITINSPFELAVNGKQADLGPRDTDSVNAEGHNQNIQIIVSASQAGSGETVDSEKQKALDIMTRRSRDADQSDDRR